MYFPVHHISRHIVYVAHNHDDWPLFRVWFAVATVTASIVLNLGIFTLLVAIHMALDVIKYRTKHKLSWHWVFVETIREGLIDVFFIALGLLMGIAFHHAVAIGGLGKLARLEVMMLNLILRVGPRLKIAEHLLEVILYWKHHFEEQFTPRAPLNKPEKGILAATLVCVIGIAMVPLFTSMSWGDVGKAAQYELTPRLELSITKTIEGLNK